MIQDEEAQVHILEMLTLFWLFFMSATFLIRVHVPDAPSVAHDASLEIAGDDVDRRRPCAQYYERPETKPSQL